MKPDYIWCQCFYTRVPICYKSLVLIVVPLAKNGSSPIIGAISFEAFEAVWSCRNWCWKKETDTMYTRRTVALICDERLRRAAAVDCIWWLLRGLLSPFTIHAGPRFCGPSRWTWNSVYWFRIEIITKSVREFYGEVWRNSIIFRLF